MPEDQGALPPVSPSESEETRRDWEQNGPCDPDDVAANKAGGLWYRRWHAAMAENRELRAALETVNQHSKGGCR